MAIDSSMVEKAHKLMLVKNLRGYTFCLTGKMSMQRSDIERFITLLGGNVTGTVLSRTNVLIVADGSAMSSKQRAASDQGKTILTESEFCEMILPSVDFLRGDNSAWTDFGLTT